MPSPEPLRRSVAVTQSLVRSLIRQIDQSQQASSHLPETDRFLDVVKRQLLWYGNLLHYGQTHRPRRNESGTEPSRDVSYSIREEDLVQAEKMVKKAIFELIPLIKSLCEGTTDSMPYAIAGWIDYEFLRIRQSLPECRTTGVALCPVLDVNFFYRNLGEISQLFESLNVKLKGLLKPVLKSCGPEPPRLQSLPFYVGFQYAMDEDVLFNAILFHELGHHLAKEIKLRQDFEKELSTDLRTKFNERLSTDRHFTGLTGAQRKLFHTWHLARLLTWIEELFCDAFGVLVAGPQMTFALRDLSGPLLPEKAFSLTHPAQLFRAEFQWSVLNHKGWLTLGHHAKDTNEAKEPQDNDEEDESRAFTSSARTVFNSLEPGPFPTPSEWFWYKEDKQITPALAIVIELLQGIWTDIEARAGQFVPDADQRADAFWDTCSMVSKGFHQLIVPSTIVVGSSEQSSFEPDTDTARYLYERGRIIHPHPTTLINVARVIFETGSRGLIENWPEMNVSDVSYEEQQHVERRLSAWTQQGISDWLLFPEHLRSRAGQEQNPGVPAQVDR